MSSTDRRLVRRPQTTIIESSVEPHEEEEEERERPRRLRAEMLRRPPRFRIELNERSIVSLVWFSAPCILAALLIYVVNMITNLQGVEIFSWAALRDAQAIMGAATFVVIGALYALLVWCCFKVLQALVELLEKVANLFLMIGHGIADIIGKIKRHGVLVEQPNYAAFTDPATGRPIFCQVSRDAITAKVDVNKLQEQQQVSPPPQLAIPPGPSEECINLSPHYQMHVDELLSQRGFLLGTSGSGKSSTTAVIAEDLTDMGVPYVIFDTEGEYLRLPAHMGQGHTICNWT